MLVSNLLSEGKELFHSPCPGLSPFYPSLLFESLTVTYISNAQPPAISFMPCFLYNHNVLHNAKDIFG